MGPMTKVMLIGALALCLRVSHAQTTVDIHDIACPTGRIAVPLAEPPGTTAVKLVRMVCVPLDPAVFAIRNGTLTLIASPPPALVFVYDAGLAGAVDGVNAVFTLPSVPSNPASLMLFRNGLKLTVGVDFTLMNQTITFLPTSLPQPFDLMFASYLR